MNNATSRLEKIEAAVITRLAGIGQLYWLGHKVRNLARENPDHLKRIIGYCWKNGGNNPHARDKYGNVVWWWNQTLMLYRWARSPKVQRYWKSSDEAALQVCFYIALHLGRIKARTTVRDGWVKGTFHDGYGRLLEWAGIEEEEVGFVALSRALSLPWKTF